MTYEMRELQDGDFVYENLRDYEKKFANVFGIDKLTVAMLASTHPFTLLVDGEIIGSAGFHIYHRGVCEVWMSATKLFEQHWRACIRFMKQQFDIMEQAGIWRFQCPISRELLVNRRFVEFLGFHPEGLMEKFGPWADDYMLYAKVIR